MTGTELFRYYFGSVESTMYWDTTNFNATTEGTMTAVKQALSRINSGEYLKKEDVVFD